MDNFKLDFVSKGKESLTDALKLVFAREAEYNAKKATHWRENAGTLVLLSWKSDEDKESIPLVAPMTAEDAAPMVWNWLNNQRYPQEPGIDGSTEKGFRIQTAPPTMWSPLCYAICIISPEWAEYHK